MRFGSVASSRSAQGLAPQPPEGEFSGCFVRVHNQQLVARTHEFLERFLVP